MNKISTPHFDVKVYWSAFLGMPRRYQSPRIFSPLDSPGNRSEPSSNFNQVFRLPQPPVNFVCLSPILRKVNFAVVKLSLECQSSGSRKVVIRQSSGSFILSFLAQPMGLEASSYILHFYAFMSNETYKHINLGVH